MKALILVDLQNDFMPGGALAVDDGDAVIPLANALVESGIFDRVFATQDWHPADHGSFADNHPGRAPGEQIDLAGLAQILWPRHCVQDSDGAAFHADLDLAGVQQIFKKGTNAELDSYSGFFDNGKRSATGLGEALTSEGVDQVYILGLATDYCVKFTALDARQLGFETFLIEDACRGVELKPGDITAAIDEMKAAGVEPVRSETLLREKERVIAEGRYLRLKCKVATRWEYVERKNISGIVVLVALTGDEKLLLVEQFRPPMNRSVIELPAGLAGDIAGAEDEPMTAAALRELEEETGYRAQTLEILAAGPPSPGLTNEVVTFIRATALKRIGEGGGDASESIVVHEISLANVPGWLVAQQEAGKAIDVKVYAGLYFAGLRGG